MKQEIEVILTLEVDVDKSKQDIINEFNILFNGHYCFAFIKIKSIKEESELYDTECNLDYKKLNEKFTNKLYSFSKEEILEYLKTI